MATTNNNVVSWETLLRITGIGLILAFCLYFKQILIIFIGALVISTSLEGLVEWSQKIFRKRFISVILVYISLLLAIGFFLYTLTPLLLNNLVDLINQFPDLLERPEISGILNRYMSEEGLAGNLLNTQNVLNYAKGLFENVGIFFTSFANILLTFLISFYISLDKDWFRKFIDVVSPKKYRDYLFTLWDRSERKMRFWLYSQIVISFIIGVFTFVVLHLLGVQFSLLAAILNGGLEFIPFIGPIIATVAILVVNIKTGRSYLFIILLSLLGIQYLENIISPVIRGKILQINPLVIIFALAIGAKVGGAIGILVAVPLSTVLAEFLRDLTCSNFPGSVLCKQTDLKE